MIVLLPGRQKLAQPFQPEPKLADGGGAARAARAALELPPIKKALPEEFKDNERIRTELFGFFVNLLGITSC